jgi:uncharacterized protein YhaN
MKFLTLQLKAFGPFTDREISLDHAGGGFHLFYGRNEAGKSSALRAIRQLLFGIDRQTADSFLHPKASLRLAAVIAPQKGEPIQFVRRKGDKNTLRQGDDQTAFPEDKLREALAGVDQAMFTSMFGIDHPQLRAGGREIVAGKGRLAETLFSAASGIANLQGVRRSLERDGEELYKKGGKNQRITEQLKKLKDSRSLLQTLQLPGEDWRRRHEELQGLESSRGQLAERLQKERTRLNRLNRLKSAIEPVAEWRQQLLVWAELKDAPQLTAELCGKAETALQEYEVKSRLRDAARSEFERLERDLAPPGDAERILADEVALEQLRGEFGGHLKAQKDRPKIQSSVERLERNAADVLERLGPIDQALAKGNYVIAPDRRTRIVKLGATQEALHQQRRDLAKRVGDLTADVESARQRVGVSRQALDPGVLRDVVRRLRGLGDLEGGRKKLAEELARRRAAVQARVDRLALWHGAVEQLSAMATPSSEQVERADAELRELEVQTRNARKAADDVAGRHLDAESRLARLEAGGSVPTEGELQTAREHRDAEWRTVRESWRSGGKVNETVVSAFETSMQQSDRLADRLRTESARVAQKAALIAEIATLDESRRRAEADVQRIATEREQAEARWATLWTGLAVSPGIPSEMRKWLAERDTILTDHGECREIEIQLDESDSAIADAQKELSAARGEAGLAELPPSVPLKLALLQTEASLQEIEQQRQESRQAKETLEKLETELQKTQAAAERHEQEYRLWIAEWTESIGRLGVSDRATAPEVLEVVKQVDELAETLRKAADERERVLGIDQESQLFTAAVRKACGVHHPELAAKPVEDQMRGLVERLDAARTSRDQRKTVQKQHDRQRQLFEEAKKTSNLAELQLEEICLKAGGVTRDDLRATIERAEARRSADQKKEQLQRQLSGLAAGTPLTEFVDQVSAIDSDQIAAEIRTATDQLAALESDLERMNQEIGAARTRFELMDGKGDAADQANLCDAQASEVLDAVREYVVLKLSAAVLQRGIERYRKDHEGPLLSRASSLFSSLTSGSFQGLRSDLSEKGDPLLVGVRSNEKMVHVEEMSDGTCDQLYLALRLAGLEAWIEEHEPMPFIVDDILLHFDDDRAGAALEVLAELSQRTQVLFFTHHHRLLELARDEGRVSPELLRVHEL